MLLSRAIAGLGCLVFVSGALASCIGHAADGPGEPLGKFHVEASTTANECGEGALGLTSSWEFDVELRRTQSLLLWDNGKDIVEGRLEDDDKQFSFEITFDVDMRTDEDPAWLPDCTITRTDTARGSLSSAGEDVEGFTGDFTYVFEPTEDSDCTNLYGPDGPLFHVLPCTVKYAFVAERTVAPEDMPDTTRDGDRVE
jgi:hypothetical protein